jgi:molybdate transport system substrate-binding protein
MRNALRSVLFCVLVFNLFVLPAHAGDVSMSVAASLKEAVTDLCTAFSKASPAVKFQNNFGASGALAKQIESGAPADLFFSANLEWMDYLKERKVVEEKNVDILAYNTLVFVGKPESKVGTLQDIVRLGRIAIGSPKSVPAGEYAMDALTKTGLDVKLKDKLVMAKDVRECLLYADRGEVDGAFVYKTDAEQMAKNVKVLFAVPQDLYPRVTYPVGLTVSGSRKPEAANFLKFLQTAEAKAVLTRYGFIVK